MRSFIAVSFNQFDLCCYNLQERSVCSTLTTKQEVGAPVSAWKRRAKSHLISAIVREPYYAAYDGTTNTSQLNRATGRRGLFLTGARGTYANARSREQVC
jgi:L-asparaginase II